MAEADGAAAKALGGLLNGIVQRVYYNNSEITEDLLKDELYPETSQEDFKALHDKMRALLKSIAQADMDQAQLEAFLTAQTRRQGAGGVSAEQASALTRLWRSQRARVRESLLGQSRWEPGLRGLSWRVDLGVKGGGRQGGGAGDQGGGGGGGAGGATQGPTALMELELGRPGQDSEFVCLELDEAKVNQVLKKMADIQQSIDRIVQRT